MRSPTRDASGPTRTFPWLERITFAILLTWMTVFVTLLGTSVVNSYSRLPAMDYWETIAHLDGYLRFPPAVLWEQHYEHRVVFAEIVIAIDWLFLRGREILPLVLNFLLDLGVWLVFVASLRRLLDKSQRAVWCSLFLAGVVMFWPGVAVVVAFPFLLQWLIYQFAATASFACLAFGRPRWAILLALIATYSSANGIFTWPLLLFIGIMMGIKRQQLLQIFVIAAIASSLYFVGYHNLGNSHLSHIWKYTAKFLGYFVTFLGMPLGAAGTWTALCCGTASLVICVVLGFLIWKWRLLREPAVLTIGCLLLLTLATAFVTSLSRIPVDRPFVDAIITPGRYVNTGAHYWAALVLLTFVVAKTRSVRLGWGVISCFAVIFGITLSQSGPWIHSWMNQYALYQWATVEIESGVDLKRAGDILNYADGTLATRNLIELERRHLSLYSWPEYQLLGQHFIPPPGSLQIPASGITAIDAIPGGVQIIGWVHPLPRSLVVVDGSGTVVGFGRHPGAGLPLPLAFPPGHERESFMAAAGPSFRAENSNIFALP